MSRTLVVRGPTSLSGRASVPPDKSIAHRGLLFAALAQGESVVTPYRPGRDVERTEAALRHLGIQLRAEGEGLVVVGGGRATDWPGRPDRIDCGNSGTTLRLLAGVLAGRPGPVVLDGDASLRRRPMERLRPLESMGARLTGESPLRAPVRLEGGALVGGRFELQVASAQVKSALLLAGLDAAGPTEVAEPGPSRDHTERWFRALGVSVEVGPGRVRVEPRSEPWSGTTFEVPPDPSSAAFLLAAGALGTSGQVHLRMGANPRRLGFVDALSAMGVPFRSTPAPDMGPEPVVDAEVEGGARLRSVRIDASLALRALDELPLLMGMAAFSEGTTRIEGAAELRVKESDRIDAMVRVLQRFGISAIARPDGAVITGGRPRGAMVDASGDHRIAMTAAVMGTAAEGTTEIRGAEVIDVSFPSFVDVLRSLGADIAWTV